MSIVKRKANLIEELRDKEYRDAFVATLINTGIPFQIRALREQREWTQSELADLAQKKQSWISRLENTNYRGFSLQTLMELASVFDVGLVVRFVPIGQLVEWELGLSKNSLAVPSFQDDPYFHTEVENPPNTPTALTQTNEQLMEGNKLFPYSEFLARKNLKSAGQAQSGFEGNKFSPKKEGIGHGTAIG